MLDNVRGNLCCPCKYYKNEKKYRANDVLRSHLIMHGFMEDYRCWNKHGEEGFNEVEMRDSYTKREVKSASMPLVDFGILNDNLIKGLVLCVKCLSRF
jgi:hypothetical protein